MLLGGAIFLLGVLGSDVKATKLENGEPAPPAKKFRYFCNDGKSFAVEFQTAADCALLTLDGKIYNLPRLISGSGARYGDGKTTLWIKGEAAFLEVDGEITMKNCRRPD